MDSAAQVRKGVRKKRRLESAIAGDNGHLDDWILMTIDELDLGFKIHAPSGVEFLPCGLQGRPLEGSPQLSVEQEVRSGDVDLRPVALWCPNRLALAVKLPSLVGA